MHFHLKTPCKHCPFTKNCLKGWLGAQRMRQILESLDNDLTIFPCHETTRGGEWDEEEGKYQPSGNEQPCAGALIYQEAHNQRAVLTRMAIALNTFDPAKLRGKTRVFKTAAAAIRHHAGSRGQ